MNQGWTYTDRVAATATGQTVLDYYTQRYRHSSSALWQSRIEQGQVLLDGQRVSAQTVLKTGQALSYYRLPWQEPTVPLKFNVLYEDEDLWAIAKPAGLPVLPGGGFLEHTILHQMRSRYPTAVPVPVHRLGRGTSGVMLLAKSHLARSHLSRQLRDRSMQKIYRALIGPTTPEQLPAQFTCKHPIGKLSYPPLGYLYAHTMTGKASHSEGTVVQRGPASTLVEIAILTGRPHQIRIHLAAVGYPLLGDPLYVAGGIPAASGSAMPGDCGYHLHAHRLRFIHPHTGKPVSVVAEPPAVLRPSSASTLND